MKTLLTATALSALLIGAASAADVYSAGSLKDSGFGPAVSNSRAGFYATGLLGYSWGNRDIRQTVNRELGIYAEVPPAPAREDFEGEGAEEAYEAAKADYDAQVKAFEAMGGQLNGTTASLPLIGDVLNNAGDADIGGFVYGAEVSYLFHNGGRFGFEPAVGVTFYGDDSGGIAHSEKAGILQANLGKGLEDVAASPFTQSGFASAERDYDIDVLLRGYYFVNDRLALTLGGGVSIATADVCGSSRMDGVTGGDPLSDIAISAFNTQGCKSDTSVGPMIEAGFKFWATDRVSVVGRVDAKWHEFGADIKSGAELPFGESGAGLYGNSTNHIEVDDVMWSAKAGVSIKLD